MKKLLLAAAVMAAVVPSTSLSATVASDNASNAAYNDGWAPGDNGGTGFGSWTLTSTPAGGFSGSYIGGTAVGNPAFGLYSGGNAAATVTALRPFTGGGLTAGQSFGVTIGNTPTINTGGQLGLSLMSGGTACWTLKFVGGGANWLLNDGGNDFDSGQAYAANTSLALTFTYNGGNSYSYTFGTGSGNNFTAGVDISNLDGVQFFSVNQGDGQNIGFNNLSVVPEPSTYALLGIAVLGFAAQLARRRRRDSH